MLSFIIQRFEEFLGLPDLKNALSLRSTELALAEKEGHLYSVARLKTRIEKIKVDIAAAEVAATAPMALFLDHPAVLPTLPMSPVIFARICRCGDSSRGQGGGSMGLKSD